MELAAAFGEQRSQACCGRQLSKAFLTSCLTPTGRRDATLQAIPSRASGRRARRGLIRSCSSHSYATSSASFFCSAPFGSAVEAWCSTSDDGRPARRIACRKAIKRSRFDLIISVLDDLLVANSFARGKSFCDHRANPRFLEGRSPSWRGQPTMKIYPGQLSGVRSSHDCGRK